MPASARIAGGNELFDVLIYVPNINVPNLPATSTANSTTTVQGLLPGDLIGWNWQGNVANVVVENFYVSAPNTLTTSWSNGTIAAINGTPPQPFLLEVSRSDVTAPFGPVLPFLPSSLI